MLHICNAHAMMSLEVRLLTIGERIRARRKQLSISADTLAEYVGVSRATVFRWENGDIEKISAGTMNVIAVVLQTTSKYLMGFSDDPEAKEEGVNYSEDAPKTKEAKIISHGIDSMPPKERERAVEMFRLMFAKYADKYEGDDNDDT